VKTFVALGPEAEHLLVIAATHDRTGHTALLVRRGAQGLSAEGDDARAGARAARSCSLRFERVRVAADQVVGEEGAGLAVAEATLDAARIGAAAHAVGIARGAFERAAARVKARKQESPPPDLQSVEFSIADMATEIDAARLLVLRAARTKDVGGDATAEGSIAKLFAGEMTSRVTHRALLVFGREGTTSTCDVERYQRAARMAELDGAGSEILRARIAGSTG
jgi:butyryl-CoA dehydrogenase